MENLTQVRDVEPFAIAGQEPAPGLVPVGDDVGQLDAPRNFAGLDVEEQDVGVIGASQAGLLRSEVDGDQITLRKKQNKIIVKRGGCIAERWDTCFSPSSPGFNSQYS